MQDDKCYKGLEIRLFSSIIEKRKCIFLNTNYLGKNINHNLMNSNVQLVVMWNANQVYQRFINEKMVLLLVITLTFLSSVTFYNNFKLENVLDENIVLTKCKSKTGNYIKFQLTCVKRKIYKLLLQYIYTSVLHSLKLLVNDLQRFELKKHGRARFHLICVVLILQYIK